MSPPPLPLTVLVWTPDLADALARASAALARLDARISASSFAPAWDLRARWSGYAAALQLNRVELEEIDIIAAQCGLRLPGRPLPATVLDPFSAWECWGVSLAAPQRHWREDLPFTFDLPEDWAKAPILVRALALLDAWASKDPSLAPWLALPVLLHRMGLTDRPLPCLVAGDPGQRFAQGPRPALLMRLLKQIARASEDGLVRLERLEATARRSAAAIAAQRRPGQLATLGRLALTCPCLAARTLAPQLGLTISGAGKLLERATRLGMMVNISARETWRAYATPDIALALRLVPPARGRPPGTPSPSPALDTVLATFDAEMAEIDARLARIGVTTPRILPNH